jgi:hypothetical protein
MNNKFFFKTDMLSDDENNLILKYFKERKNNFWLDKNTDFNEFPLNKILDFVGQYFDLTDMVGCECWAHFNTKPGWHTDKDETLYSETNEIKTPLCSIVYYASVKDLIGGRFIAENIEITPQKNSLLTFERGLEHNVENFTGERIAIAINPWSYKIVLPKPIKLEKTLF